VKHLVINKSAKLEYN